MIERIDADIQQAVLNYLAQLQATQRGGQPCNNILVINVNSPITLNSRAQGHGSWLGHAIHLLENSSLRVAVCLISLATLIGIVAYKIGYPSILRHFTP